MSVLDDKKNKLETKSGTGTFIWLLLILIIAGAINLFYGLQQSGQNQKRLAKAGDLRVLSQQIAKNASEASQGREDAFKQLKNSTTEFQTKFNHLYSGESVSGLDESPDDIKKNQLRNVESSWKDMKNNSDVVLNGKETILSLHDILNQLNVSIPQIQGFSDDIRDILLDSNASAQQVMLATRQLHLSEKIVKNLQKVLTGGEGLKESAETFGLDVGIFGSVLNGMLDGDAMMGVSRVRNGEAREILQEIVVLYEPIISQVEYVNNSADELIKVHTASDQVFRLANEMLGYTQTLQDTYQNYVAPGQFKKYLGSPYLSAVIGGLIFILLVLLYLRQRKDDKGRTERARVSRDQEKRQNEKNQQAIIRLLDEMEGLADGDLTTNATVTEDFTGAIADAMNFTIDQLRNLVSTIKDSVVKLANATDATQNISRELAQASRNQAQEITGASAAINEMAVSIEQVSANASESATVAEKSVDIAKKGGEVVRNTIQGMDTIREQIQETSKRIKRLGESSQEIGDIVSLINDISDQTNILALNAAIQASMAGEAGRGFAVVADEVQRLAERSGNATKQIEALVKTIQTDTNEAVISMEASTSEVVHGARLAQDAGVALEEIERVSKSLADLIQNISNAARQQAASAGHVSNTMNVIQEITNQTSEGSQNTATSIGTLAELADELNNSIAGFKLPDEV